jgi:hypothetical protein
MTARTRMSSTPRPVASLSLDVDNLWSYLKIHGDPAWSSRPSYLDRFIPHVLGALEELGLRITFFIVGRDAAEDANGAALRSIATAGHEVGNHSFEHEPWLHTYSPEQVRRELQDADAAIRAATGLRPVGFRGPGFSWSPEVLRAVAELDYAFDASTFPTFLGPLARAYYFATAKLTPEEREQRKALFGGLAEGLRPLDPYRWSLGDGRSLLEIPVTTMPVARLPFHLSYLVYLSRVSEGLAMAYLHAALGLCRATGTEPSFLLHPLDLIGGDLAPQLRFFPGMDVDSERKTRFFQRVLRALNEGFELVPMGEHAGRIAARERLPQRALPAGAAA